MKPPPWESEFIACIGTCCRDRFKPSGSRRGPIRVKIADLGDGRQKMMPEYQDCKKLAEQTGHSIREIMEQARQALESFTCQAGQKAITKQEMIKNQSKPSRPILAVTMGDPAGIGPEIILKALNQPRVWRVCCPIVIGSIPVMKKTAKALRLPMKVVKIDGHSASMGSFKRGLLPIFDPFEKPLNRFRQGQPSAIAGEVSAKCIEIAVHWAQMGCVEGIVTSPINKKAIHLAGYRYPGHTEMLGNLTQSKEVGMMILGGPIENSFYDHPYGGS